MMRCTLPLLVFLGAAACFSSVYAQESPDSVVEEGDPATRAMENELQVPAVSAPPPLTPPMGTPDATAVPAEGEGAASATAITDIAPDPLASLNGIKLQVLDKVTARISVLEGPLGGVQNFGNLEIIARVCWKSPPTAQPENAALLDIYESKAGASPKRIFTGWMFSSSPALSALEHPVYDITVLECREVKSDAL